MEGNLASWLMPMALAMSSVTAVGAVGQALTCGEDLRRGGGVDDLEGLPPPSSMPQSTRMPDRGGALYHFNTFTLPRTGRPPKMAHSSDSRMVDFPAALVRMMPVTPSPSSIFSFRCTRMLVSVTLTSLISLARVSQGRAWRGASVHVVGQGRPAWPIKDS